MSKANFVCVGMDVAAKTLAVACHANDAWREEEFPNTPEGHKTLWRFLRKQARRVRICMEATGIYHLEAAITLAEQKGCEVMVVNPRVSKDFARAMNARAKTDRVDARMLAMFCERMPFVRWQPPAKEVLELRAIGRRMDDLARQAAAEKNRLHATTIRSIARDIQVNIRHLERRIQYLGEQARRLIERHDTLLRGFTLLTSVKGVAETSAIRILGEVMLMPEGMSGKQWVAHAGLDPRSFESGASVRKKARISKTGNAHLRRALFLPAMSAARFDPGARNLRNILIKRGLKPIQAIIAIMRRLLLAIRAMLRDGQPFQSDRFLQASTHA
jgi:Transposase and inactivated derivatives